MFVALNSAGCAMSYENYANDVGAASCTKFSECDMLDFFGGTEDSCLNYQQAYLQGAEGDTNVCPNYDSKSAKDCVTGWEDLTCSQLQDGQTPAVCDSVCSAGSTATVQ
ncbi:MAG: hypothetical protein GXP62_00345 [Oligoflexia bacterium]|nr:hypothetical protein [Oligoflexia bacterium]